MQTAERLDVRCEPEEKSQEEQMYETLGVQLNRLCKDAEGMQKRMNVHDTDQRKAIAELEARIEVTRAAIAAKTEYSHLR